MLGNFSAKMTRIASSSPIRSRQCSLFERWTREIEDAISEAQQRGEVSTQTPAPDLAAFLLDAYEGAILRARVEKTAAAFDRFMTLAFDRILR